MTSQLVLINAQGVAIASDSAVTLGGGRRTLDTAVKVLPLPGPHRIAVLHSGLVHVHGLPYQVLLNECFSTLCAAPLATVEAYRQDFLDWLGNNLQWFSTDRIHREWIGAVSQRFDIIRDGVLRKIKDDPARLGPERATLEEVRLWAEGLSTFPTFENTDDEWLRSVGASLAEGVLEVFEYWFDDIPRSEEIDRHLHAYAAEFVRRSGPWDDSATLSFVGFGESQVLPGYSDCDISGVLGGRVLHVPAKSWVGVSDNDPIFAIHPLGQTSAINLFLRGAEHEMVEVAANAAVEQVGALRTKLGEVVGEEVASSTSFHEAFDSAVNQMMTSIGESVWDDSEQRYVDPLRLAIAGLPLATLADVARSLVELQALRQTTTAEQSTVGGPIDVAIISRAGGFGWVRHKTTR